MIDLVSDTGPLRGRGRVGIPPCRPDRCGRCWNHGERLIVRTPLTTVVARPAPYSGRGRRVVFPERSHAAVAVASEDDGQLAPRVPDPR